LPVPERSARLRTAFEEDGSVQLIPRIQEFHDELTAWRRDIHAHPELGFQEQRTSDVVADKLAQFGIEVHRGIGKTGVVGVLRVGNSHRSIGLRADMDALPILEANRFEHRSRHDGRMHACGHDGHTTKRSARRAISPRRASSTARSTSSSSPPRKGSAAPTP
jgi:hypothetical protein